MSDKQKRREIRRLGRAYANLRANALDRPAVNPIPEEYPEESTAWPHFERLHALLHRHGVWEDYELYLEAQFELWVPPKPRLKMPPYTTLYSSLAWKKYKRWKVKKRRRHMGSQHKEVKQTDLAKPYEESFLQSAYSLRVLLNDGFHKEEIYRHLSNSLNPHFIASDPDCYADLMGNRRAYKKVVRQAFASLRNNSQKRKALRKLWRKVCRQQQIIL